MDNGHIVFQTCENIARLTYANSQLPLLCEFFLIPATLLVFRFKHFCRELDHTTGMLYIDSKICSYWSYCILLHLIASCLDDQILGLPRPLKGPMGLFSPGIAMEHLGSTIRRPNPLGKNMPSRIWDSSLRMTDGWLICGIVNHRRWRWHLKNRPTNVENNDFCSFVGPSQSKMRMCFLSLIPVFLFSAVGVPPGLGQHVFWNRIYPETQARRSDSVDFFLVQTGNPFFGNTRW